MKLKPKKLTDQELVQACRDLAEKGNHLFGTDLVEERAELFEYYAGERPYQTRPGGSKFVSQDVYLSVENMKAEIVETFGAGSNIVAFSPQGADDVESAKHATAYTSMAIHEQNTAILLFQDIVHDGLMNRFGVAKVYWDRNIVAEPHEIADAPAEQVAELQSQGVRFTSLKAKALAGGAAVYTGSFDKLHDLSQVRIEPLPPEEFIVSGRTKDIDRARYLAHRYRCTLGELVEDGHDAKLVYDLTDDGDQEIDMEAEKAARDPASIFHDDDDDAPDAAGKLVTVHESYIRIDAEGLGYQQLWQVIHVGAQLLSKRRVMSHPFVIFVPKPMPHTLVGDNYAKRSINHANVKTTLTRAIVEQAVEATNPRLMVARGGVQNPRELIDNRRGGIVNVRSLTDSVAPMPQTPINPFVLQTIGLVDQDREDTTGISRLSQGLDKGALSHQNSQGLVKELTSNSQTRTKVISRIFAHMFVAPLYRKVYEVALANESGQRMLEIGGNFVPVDVSRWRTRRDLRVDMTLGYKERDIRAEELMTFDRYLKEQEVRGYDEQRRYNLLKDVLEIKGIKDTNRYLADPQTLEPPKPDPMQELTIAELKQKVENLARDMAVKEAKAQAEIAAENEKLVMAREAHDAELGFKQAESLRKDAEVANRIDISLAELELAIETASEAGPEDTKITAIASPNS